MSEPTQLQNTIGRMDPAEEAPAKSPAQEDIDKGKQYMDGGDLGQAAASFHNALVGFEQENDENGIANAVTYLGDICVARESFDHALENYQRAYDICDNAGDSFSILMLKKKMLTVYQNMGNDDKAVSLGLQILDIYGGHNNPQGAVRILEQLADIYRKMGEKNKAADAYRTAASIHVNFKHPREAQSLIKKAEALEGTDK